ncbi:MAG: DMT family transporter [Actinomycetota bacterium]|nr:DMT family transporter [Actinomycetota bacterium]
MGALSESQTMGGVAACAVYTILVKSLLLEDSAMAVVALQQLSALVLALALLVGAAVLGLVPVLPRVSAVAWASAIGSGLLYYAVAFWFYVTGLRQIPATIAGSFISLIPVFGITAGYLLLGERLSGRQWLGAVLILAAVVVILRGQRSAMLNLTRPT